MSNVDRGYYVATCRSFMQDAALLALSICAGGAMAFVMRLNHMPEKPDISVQSLFLHNALIGMVSVAMGVLVARIVMAASVFALGHGVVASLLLVGSRLTFCRIFPHAFIEICAWLYTLRMARKLTHEAGRNYRSVKEKAPKISASFTRDFIVLIVLYAVAAGFEYVEVMASW